MKWSIENKVAVGFACALVIGAVVAAFFYRTNQLSLRSSERVAHTYQVLRALENTLVGVFQTESGARGYALTGGQRRFLDGFEAGKLLARNSANQVAVLTEDNPIQQDRVRRLQELVTAKSRRLDGFVRTFDREGFAAAAAITKTGVGKRMTDEMSRIVAQMVETEETLLTERSEALAAEGRLTSILWATGGVLTLLLFGLIYAFVRWDIKQRSQVETALRDSQLQFESFMNNGPAQAFIKDEQGRYIYINRTLERTFNTTQAELLGRTDFEWLPEEVARQVRTNDEAIIASGNSRELLEMVPAGSKNHEWLVFKFPFKTSGGQQLLGGIAIDVTEQRRTERRLAVQHQLSEILVGATSLETVAPALLRFLVEGLEWDLAELWLVNGQAEALYLLDSWHKFNVPLAHFDSVTDGLTFEWGQGLPGQVWAAGRPVWMSDVTEDKSFVRAISARFDGLHGAFGFPITEGGTVWGVMTLFSRQIQTPDEEMMATASSVGNQLGQFVERQRVQQALQASEQRFRTLVEQATDTILVYDLEGRLIDVNQHACRSLGYSREELLALRVADIDSIVQKTADEQPWSSQIDQLPLTVESVHRRKDGSTFPVENRISLLELAEEAFILALVRDVSDRKQAEAQLQQTNDRMSVTVKKLERRTKEMALTGQMSQLLQACLKLDEATGVMGHSLAALFTGLAGEVALVRESGNLVEPVVHWGEPAESVIAFEPRTCWALRRGQMHFVEEGNSPLRCQHLQNCLPAAALCVPLTAQGETLGVLTLRELQPGSLEEDEQKLALVVAEQIALAVANLKLREKLRDQSLRDPLTGLFNRRYLEETIERELYRVQRSGSVLSVLMLDVDHFKSFNDRFGHDAGDVVLQAIGNLLLKQVRNSDIACRFGGEEFLIVLPDATLQTTVERAELLRLQVEQLHLLYRGEPLGPVTISIGAASLDEHGPTSQTIIQAADEALYAAKRGGRNRVLVAPTRRS